MKKNISNIYENKTLNQIETIAKLMAEKSTIGLTSKLISEQTASLFGYSDSIAQMGTIAKLASEQSSQNYSELFNNSIAQMGITSKLISEQSNLLGYPNSLGTIAKLASEQSSLLGYPNSLGTIAKLASEQSSLSYSKLFNNSIAQMEITSKLISEQTASLFGYSDSIAQMGTIAKLASEQSSLSYSELFNNSIAQIEITSKLISEQSNLFGYSDSIAQMGTIAKLASEQSSLSYSKLFNNSIAQMEITSKLISEQTASLFGYSDSIAQMGTIAKLISEQIRPISESDIMELSQFMSENENNEIEKNYYSSIIALEELRIETLNHKFKLEEINKKIEKILQLVKLENNSLIVNLILNLLASFIFTYWLQPVIDHFILNKSQISKELMPNLKNVIKTTELSNYRIVVVKSFLNVKSKPKIQSNTIFHLSNGDLVEIVRKEKNWTLIKKYDSINETIIQGWVNTRYLLKIQ